MVEEVSTWWSI